MNSPARRPGSGLSRRSREDRAYRLVIAGGAAAAVAVVTFVLAVIGILGFAWPLVAVIVALVCGFLFKRTTGT
jgi:putative flippase GtrA